MEARKQGRLKVRDLRAVWSMTAVLIATGVSACNGSFGGIGREHVRDGRGRRAAGHHDGRGRHWNQPDGHRQRWLQLPCPRTSGS